MSHRQCLICLRLVPTVMRLVHLANEHPVVAVSFRQEKADIDVLFQDVRN